MAKPQLEDGHTRIANEILEHLVSTHLSSNQWQVLIFIIRKTYGFNKKVDYIANFQICEATGLCKAVVSRVLQKLENMNMINKKGKFIGFQKDWEAWEKVSSIANNEKLAEQSTIDTKLAIQSTNKKLAIQSTELAEQSTKVSSCAVAQKTKDNIQKTIYKEWFIKLWKAYPLHKDRLKAEMLFEKIKPSEELVETMIQAIERQKAEKKYSNGFTPEWKYLATWLRGECWTDEAKENPIKKRRIL